MHLSELPAAEHISKQAQSPSGVFLLELMLQGKMCSLSLELWAWFPQLNPFTDRRGSYHGDMAMHLHEDCLPTRQLSVSKTWVVLLLLLWYLSDSVSSSIKCE